MATKGESRRSGFRRGDCVRIPDGRPGRVRDARGDTIHVRVRRRGGTIDDVLELAPADLSGIDPPAGWMTPEGYNRRVAAARRRAKARRGSNGRG